MADPLVPVDHTKIELTARELAIARAAARLAVQEMTDDFYRQVGKTIVTKVLIWIGMAVLGFCAAKGWIYFTPPK